MMSGLLDLILTAVCNVLFFICKWLLRFVELVEMFFNVFAGTEKILYGDEKTYLINIFFGHDAITNAFWAMAIVAMILSIGFTIVALARKVTDVSGTTKHTIGQIVSNFVRSMLAILLLNLCIVASINVANVLLDQIDFALTNAEILDVEGGRRQVDEAEYAAMTRILATVANYNVNKGSEMRYNVNACFNAIRTDLQALQARKFFDYEYAMTPSGHHTWQTALVYAANAADLSVDLNLNQYYPQVDEAIRLLAKELSTNPEFKPVEAGTKEAALAPNMKVMLFLVSSFGAEHNSIYANGSMEDALRRGYLTEEKDCADTDTVKKDFDLTKINYLLLLSGSLVFLMLMVTSIIQFIERLFNLVLFYITGPLFASSMSLDEGGKFQSWLQGFVLQLLGAFGTVLVMRIYLIIMPLLSSDALVFFPNAEGFWASTINYMAQLILIIGGAFAVSKASGIIGAALAGNSAMAAMGQQGEAAAIGGALVKKGAMSAAKGGFSAAVGAAKIAADPWAATKKGAGAVAGAAGAVKKAFVENQTLGAIGSGISYLRNRGKNKDGQGKSEKSQSKGATYAHGSKTAQGSNEHVGAIGSRMKLDQVTSDKKQAKEAPAAGLRSRPTMESMFGGGAGGEGSNDQTKVNPPGSQVKVNPLGSQANGNPPGSQAKVNPPGSQANGNPPGSQVNGNPPGSRINGVGNGFNQQGEANQAVLPKQMQQLPNRNGRDNIADTGNNNAGNPGRGNVSVPKSKGAPPSVKRPNLKD